MHFSTKKPCEVASVNHTLPPARPVCDVIIPTGTKETREEPDPTTSPVVSAWSGHRLVFRRPFRVIVACGARSADRGLKAIWESWVYPRHPTQGRCYYRAPDIVFNIESLTSGCLLLIKI